MLWMHLFRNVCGAFSLHRLVLSFCNVLQIMHLRKYIAKKSSSNVKPEEVEVLCKGMSVGPEYSLEFIRRTIWMDDSAKMILEFRRQVT